MRYHCRPLDDPARNLHLVHAWRKRLEQTMPGLPEFRLQTADLQQAGEAVRQQRCGAWEITNAADTPGRSMLLAIPTALDPLTPKAQFFPQRYATLQFSSLEEAPRQDVFALYAAAAEFLLYKHIAVHRSAVYAAQHSMAGIWNDLGFARYHCHAVRPIEAAGNANELRQRPGNPSPTDSHTAADTCLPSGCTIRAAGPADQPVLERLFGILAARHHVASIAITRPAPPAEVYTALPGELRNERYCHRICEYQGRAVGFIDAYSARHGEGYLAPLTRGPFVYIRNCCVIPELQGRGIGTALVQEVLEWSRGCPDQPQQLHLDYRTANIPAGSFWEKCGFEPLLYGLLRVSQLPKTRGLFRR